jgi:hypothetical protein
MKPQAVPCPKPIAPLPAPCSVRHPIPRQATRRFLISISMPNTTGHRPPKSASRPHGIAAALRSEIQREIGGTHFSETNKGIPSEEYVIDKHEWPG